MCSMYTSGYALIHRFRIPKSGKRGIKDDITLIRGTRKGALPSKMVLGKARYFLEQLGIIKLDNALPEVQFERAAQCAAPGFLE